MVVAVLFHGLYDAMLFARLIVTDDFLSAVSLVGPIAIVFGGGLVLRHCAALALALDLRNPDTKRLRRPIPKAPP